MRAAAYQAYGEHMLFPNAAGAGRITHIFERYDQGAWRVSTRWTTASTGTIRPARRSAAAARP